jgi:hypothetical protein
MKIIKPIKCLSPIESIKLKKWNSKMPKWIRCGKCEQCKKLKAWNLSTLLKIHNQTTANGYFITLTYASDKVKYISKEHIRTWLKRIRKAYQGTTYSIIGEYGEIKHRPHYHATMWFNKPINESKFAQTWKLGIVNIKPISEGAINYIALHKANLTRNKFNITSNGLGKKYYQENLNSIRATGSMNIRDEKNQKIKTIPLIENIRNKLKKNKIEYWKNEIDNYIDKNSHINHIYKNNKSQIQQKQKLEKKIRKRINEKNIL